MLQPREGRDPAVQWDSGFCLARPELQPLFGFLPCPTATNSFLGSQKAPAAWGLAFLWAVVPQESQLPLLPCPALRSGEINTAAYPSEEEDGAS